jgi:hypothetical protein
VTDRYTKAVLTIIAGSLLALVAQNYIKPSLAAGVQKVILCDAENTSHCAALKTWSAGEDWYSLFVTPTKIP